MKITFVIPKSSLAGGIRVVAIYAEKLANLGHEVTVISAIKKGTLRQKFRALIKEQRFYTSGSNTTFFDNLTNVNFDIKYISSNGLSEKQVPDADIIIATWWETVEWIFNLGVTKGKQLYLIQDHEVFPYLPIERVKATYRSAIKPLVVSSWLKSVVFEQYNKNAVLINNGVDTAHFSGKDRVKSSNLRVGFIFTSVPRKNCGRAIQAINIVKKEIPDVELIGFGSEDYHSSTEEVVFDQYFKSPEQSKIPEIYASCDVWLLSSDSEGFGLPILESMSCGTPVIATPAGAAPDILNTGGGILLKGYEPSEMAEAIIKISKLSSESWYSISTKAREIASLNSWGNSSKKLEAILKQAMTSC